MYISFDQLNDTSRLWIYQGNRAFSESEILFIEGELQSFCDQWSAHGHPLKTSFRIEHNQFIILAADESYHLPSGCSIDSSVHVIKSLETQTGISFFDRALIAFFLYGKVALFPMNRLKEEFAKGTLTAETTTFNNLVGSKREWADLWMAPVKNGWLAKYLPHDVVAG